MKRIRQVATISAFFVALAITGLAADTFTALTGTGTGGAYQVGDRWGAQTAEKVRQNFNALVAPKYWTAASDSNLTNEVNLGALTSGLLKIAVSGSVATPSTVAAPTGAVVGTSDSQVLTGKTYDAEATGNVLTIPFTLDVQTATCDNGGGWSNWDFPGAHGSGAVSPDYQCVGGTSNGPIGILRYYDNATQTAYNRFKLPDDWTGTVSLKLYWFTNATTGNVVWQVKTACVADAETYDPSWNATQTITDAVKGTGLQLNSASLASVTVTGCAAGEIFKYAVFRDPANGGDTVGDDVFLIQAEWTYRRAI